MWQYHPSPRLTWIHNKRVPCGMVSPGVKENPRWTSRLPQCCRTLPSKPTSVLSHKEYWENLWGSTTRDQIETEEMRGSYSNQCSDLCRPQSCLQWLWSRDPSQWLCPSAELRQWPYLAWEFDFGSYAWYGSPVNRPYSPGSPSYCSTEGGMQSCSPS